MGFLEGLLRASQTAPTSFIDSWTRGLDKQRDLTMSGLRQQLQEARTQGDWRTVQRILKNAPASVTAGRDTVADDLMIERMQASEIGKLPTSQLTGQYAIPEGMMPSQSDLVEGPMRESIQMRRLPDGTEVPVTHRSNLTYTGDIDDPSFGPEYTDEEARQQVQAAQAAAASGLAAYEPGAIQRAMPGLTKRFETEAAAEGAKIEAARKLRNAERYKRLEEGRKAAEELRKVDKYAWEKADQARKNEEAARDAETHLMGQKQNVRDQYETLNQEIVKDPIVSTFRQTQVSYQTVMTMLSDMIRTGVFTGVGPEQIAVFNLFQRTIDPATVREGDIALQRNSMGMLENFKIYLSNLVEGQTFNKPFAESVARAMTTLYDIQQRKSKEFVDGRLEAARQVGISDDPLYAPAAVNAVKIGAQYVYKDASTLTDGMSDNYMSARMTGEGMPDDDRAIFVAMNVELRKHQAVYGKTSVPPEWGPNHKKLYLDLREVYAEQPKPPTEEAPGIIDKIGSYFGGE